MDLVMSFLAMPNRVSPRRAMPGPTGLRLTSSCPASSSLTLNDDCYACPASPGLNSHSLAAPDRAIHYQTAPRLAGPCPER